MPQPLAHPCNRSGSYRESSISRQMETAQCKHSRQATGLQHVAADVIERLAAAVEQGFTVSRQDLQTCRQVAQNLRRHG